MFIRLIIFLIGGSFCISATAQNTFELLIQFNNYAVIHSALVNKNNELIAFGAINDNSKRTGLLIRISLNGELLQEIIVPEITLNSSGGYGKKLILTEDGGYLVAYYNRMNSSKTFSIIYLNKFNEELELNWIKRFSWIIYHQIRDDIDIIQNSQNNFLLIGISEPLSGFPWYPFIFEFSEVGDSIRSVSYMNPDSPQEMWNIHKRENPITPYLITSTWFNYSDAILEVDTGLNVVSVHNFSPNPLMGYHDICPGFSSKYTYGRFYVVGWTCGGSNTPKWDIGVFNTDTDFNMVNQSFFGTSSHDHQAIKGGIDIIDTGRIYIGGIVETNANNWIILNQTNSKLKSNWIKFYGGDSSYELIQVIAMEDGGCLLIAQRYSSIYILRVDENGMIDPQNRKTV